MTGFDLVYGVGSKGDAHRGGGIAWFGLFGDWFGRVAQTAEEGLGRAPGVGFVGNVE